MFLRTVTSLLLGALIGSFFVLSSHAADWTLLSQNDFGASGFITLDEEIVAEWSATMDPVEGFQRSWYSTSVDDGLFIGLAGLNDRSPHEADISMMIIPMPGYEVSPMRWGQSTVPIHIVGGSLTFEGFTGIAQLVDDGSSGTGATDPPGPEIIDPAGGTTTTESPFEIQRRDGNAIQNPDWIVETPFANEPVVVSYTNRPDTVQPVSNEALVVDVTVQAVPEPSGLMLGLFGVMGLLRLRHQRRAEG